MLAENRFDELPVCLRRLDGTELIAEEGAWPLTWTANCFQGGRGELGIKPSPIDGRNAMELRNLGDRPGIQLYPWRLPQVAAGSVLHLEITYATVGPGGPEVHVRLDAEDSERVILPPSPGRWSSWSCSFSNGRAAGVLPFIAYVHRDQELWIRSVQLLAEPGTR